MVQSGELPAVRFGRSYRIPEAAVIDLVTIPGAGSARNAG